MRAAITDVEYRPYMATFEDLDAVARTLPEVEAFLSSAGHNDRITANLPSNDLDATQAFYARLGFVAAFKDESWMILRSGDLELEFFPWKLDPKRSAFSACVRVDDLDALHTRFAGASLPGDDRSIPRMSQPVPQHGLRMFFLVDLDGSLLRCIENPRITRPG